jgi:aminopeptidase N
LIRLNSSAASVILLVSLVVFFSSVIADEPAPLVVDGMTPSDMHRIMGDMKASALDRSRRMQMAAAGEPQADQTNYDVKWYDIFIRINDTTENLYGTVAFVAVAAVDGVNKVDVDFYSGMTVDAIEGPAGALAYVRAGNVVTVTLDRVYDAGEQFKFDFDYHGHPVEGGFQAFAFDWYNGKRSISSLSEPYFARTWWPCKDRMDDKPDSIGIHIEVDTALYCASNGTLDSITTVPGSNSRTFHYTCHHPIATYLFSVAIAPFVVWQQNYVYNNGQSTMPVVHHVYADHYDQSLTTWGQTPQMIAYLAGVYGPYPFLDEKYGHANFNWGGGMEHQTVTSMNGTSSFGFTSWVIVHELSHEWWGDLVTCKSWHDIWLNEGWATYSEAVYELERAGWPNYHAYMNSMAYKSSGTVWCDDTTDVWRIFNGGLSYDKGAWVVHMLRGVLGEALFAAGIQAYRDAFAFGAATTEDFREVWESATGVDLDPFIEQWVYGQYYPKYDYFYMDEPSDAGGYDIYLVVHQTQTTNPTVFQMPVDFFFDYSSIMDDTVTLVIDERSELFKFHEPSDVDTVKLDPAGWILKDVINRPWQMFIVTLDSELSDGVIGRDYADTVETRGGIGPNTVSMGSGTLPPGLSIANTGVISGTPTQSGLYGFVVAITNTSTGYSDQRQFDIAITEGSCCVGKVGDVNGLDGDEPTLGDIMLLVDMLFINGYQPDCLLEADVNQSGGAHPTPEDITLGDVMFLVDHLFITHTELHDCL